MSAERSLHRDVIAANPTLAVRLAQPQKRRRRGATLARNDRGNDCPFHGSYIINREPPTRPE
jgi:hypothetical protein